MIGEKAFILYVVLAILNLMAFIFVGIDKKRSATQSERVPEAHLFFVSIFFASLGVFSGMLFFRHKTRKLYFPIGIGLLVVQQTGLLFLLLSQKL